MAIRFARSENGIKPTVEVTGRFLLSLIFLVSGLSKLMNWNQSVQYMSSAGIRAVPFFLACAVILELLGGLSVLLGYKIRWGAAALFLYLIPVTLIFHDFWAYQGPAFQMQLINFLKNGAIMGGLLEAVVHGAQAWSLDARDRTRQALLTVRGDQRSLRRVS